MFKHCTIIVGYKMIAFGILHSRNEFWDCLGDKRYL